MKGPEFLTESMQPGGREPLEDIELINSMSRSLEIAPAFPLHGPARRDCPLTAPPGLNSSLLRCASSA
jgi:hypothetical protein